MLVSQCFLLGRFHIPAAWESEVARPDRPSAHTLISCLPIPRKAGGWNQRYGVRDSLFIAVLPQGGRLESIRQPCYRVSLRSIKDWYLSHHFSLFNDQRQSFATGYQSFFHSANSLLCNMHNSLFFLASALAIFSLSSARVADQSPRIVLNELDKRVVCRDDSYNSVFMSVGMGNNPLQNDIDNFCRSWINIPYATVFYETITPTTYVKPMFHTLLEVN